MYNWLATAVSDELLVGVCIWSEESHQAWNSDIMNALCSVGDVGPSNLVV